MRKASNRILSLVLAAAMVFTLLPGVTVYAEDGVDSGPALGDRRVVTAFDALPERVASQTVPLGTSMSALVLPDALDAEVDGAPDSIPIGEWQSAPEYDGDIEGTYIFTPMFSDEYTIEADVAPPVITVKAEGGGEAAQAVTFTIAEDEYGSAALYLTEGMPVIEVDLLAGVSAAYENGVPITVSVSDVDGLDLSNPQRPDGPVYPAKAYIITYAAAHPVTEEVFTATREVYVTLGAGAIMPLASTADVIDLNDTDADLGNAASGSGGRYSYDSPSKTITVNSGPVTITGSTTERRIIVSGTCSVTLDNASIQVSGDYICAFSLVSGSNVTLTLVGDNTLKSGKYRAGLQVPTGTTLTITAADTDQRLTATGGESAPGIGACTGSPGVSTGTIVINGGSVTATGGPGGAGIGNGNTGGTYTVEINGGKVTANGGSNCAGIGSAVHAGTGTVTITGGEVIATGKWGGAGIGGHAYSGAGGTVTITGGTVTATGTENAMDIGPGADYISSIGSDGSTKITGGSVNPTRGQISPQPSNSSGTPVYLNTLTVGTPHVGDGVDALAIGYDGTLPYGNNDVVTTNSGKVYAWLPQNSSNDAKVDLIADIAGAGVSYTKTWARTGTSEIQTLLRVGNAQAPSISSQPQGATYNQDDTATPLSVTASVSDGGTLSYQWYQNASNSNTGGTSVGTDSASYTPDTGTVGTLYYYCVVTNTSASVSGSQTAAATSGVATIIVNALVNAETPGITGQPQNATYNQGDTATPLSVTASVSDGGSLSFQWYQNNSNSNSGGTPVGTDSASYTPDTGTVGTLYYYCVVTNTNTGVSGSQTATATSGVATVTVVPIVDAETPGITGQPQGTAYNHGDTATPLSVTASVTDGGTLSYQWYSNTSNSTTGGATVGTNSASYTPDTSTVGTVYYYCVVTNTNTGVNGIQTATATSGVATIAVNALVNAETPSITGQPQNATYNQGDTATPLSVTASVSDGGSLTYQWYRNTNNSTTGGAAISGATSASFTPPTTTVGTTYYYVEITNTNTGATGTQTSTAVSNAAQIMVGVPASVLTLGAMNNDTATEGDPYSKTFSYTYTGSGGVTFTITGLPSSLSYNTSTGEITGTPGSGDAAGSPYTISVTVSDGTLTDNGSFTLMVNNAPIPVELTMAALSDEAVIEGYLYTRTVSVTYTGTNTLTYIATTALPTGLSVNSANGTVSGVPTVPGTYTITVEVTDGTLTDSQSYTLKVRGIYNLTLTADTGGTITTGATGQYAEDEEITIGAAANSGYTFTGWTTSNGGSFASASGASTTFTMPANDTTVTASFTYTPTLSISALANDSVTRENSYAKDISAYVTYVGIGPLTYSATGLPSGVMIDSVTGIISGAPTTAGTYDITVTVTDGTATDAHGYTLTVNSNSSSGGGSSTTYYTITFNSNGGGSVSSKSVAKNSTMSKPADPTRDGYTFTGWYTDKELTEEYDFTTKVTSAFTLYAGWAETEEPEPGATHNAYISGSPDGSFGPDNTLTRAEAAQMFYNLLSDTVSSGGSFSDVSSDAWYYDAVTTLSGIGVISGYPDGSFGPGNTITRAEFAVMAVRFAGLDAASGENAFPDVVANHWAAGYIAAAVNAGYVSGYPNGNFGPDNTVTRAEAVTILNRMRGCDGLTEGTNFTDVPETHWAYEAINAAATDHEHE